jgi:hypothetical protein
MKFRITAWAAAGFVVASGWAFYFLLFRKEHAIDPIVASLVRLSCPISIIGSHYPVSVYSALAANVATYALIGLLVELFRRQRSKSK